MRTFCKKQWWWILMGLIWILFTFVGYTRLDPDFGWHIRMGELIVKQGGVPATDPFSYTMPSFKFVDHEWATNVFMYLGYEHLGRMFLAGVFALIVVAVFVVLKPKRYVICSLVPMFLALSFFLNRAGIRPQVQSWLYLAVLLKVFYTDSLWRRFRWFVPIGMCWWANMHGSFALGVFVLLFSIVWKIGETRRILWGDVLVWLLGVIATLINPYGLRIWYEVWMQMSDGGLRQTIAEWQPFFMQIEFGFLLLAVLVAGFGFIDKQYRRRGKFVLTVVLMVAGMSSLRHIPLFGVASLMILPELFGNFYSETCLSQIKKIRAAQVYKITVLVSAVVGLFVLMVNLLPLRYGQWDDFYPKKVLHFLSTNKLDGNVFSEYAWGGYLIWNLPEKKVFIDGRMPSWRWEYWPETQVAPLTESSFAFDEYRKIVWEGEIEPYFRKYNVKVVVWPVKKPQSVYGDTIEMLAKRLGLKNNEDKSKDFLKSIEDLGWEEVFKDDRAVVYGSGIK